MIKISVLIRYQYLRLKNPQGQVAALFIVLIALVFIFMAITINIGRIANFKTALDNAVDGAALMAASGLGSYSRLLYSQTVNKDGDPNCTSYWDYGLLGIIGSSIMFFIPGMQTAAIIGMASSLGTKTIFDQTRLHQRDLMKLDIADSTIQSAILYALQSLVNDTKTITDTYDLDEDSLTTDEISMFSDYAYRHTLYLASNVVVGLDDWQEFASGPLQEFLEKIDAGYEYCSLDEEGNPRLDESGNCLEVSYTGTGDASDDYRAFLRDRFPSLMRRLMVRYYMAGDGNIDDGRFEFEDVRDQIHFNIEEAYSCPPYAQRSNWPTLSFLGCGISEGIAYSYDGIYKEGDCDPDNFNPAEADREPCDKLESMLNEIDEFDKLAYDLMNAQLSKTSSSDFMSNIFGGIIHSVFKSERTCRRSTGEEYCTSSLYLTLQDWQRQIIDWRARLETVQSDLSAKVQACKASCNNELCPVMNVVNASPFNLNGACHTFVGNISAVLPIARNAPYDPRIEDCCLNGQDCLVPGAQPGVSSACADSQGRISWDCYSDCYHSEYFARNPFNEELEDYWADCFAQRLTSPFGSDYEYYSPAWQNNLAGCIYTCELSCDFLYDVEFIETFPPNYFHDTLAQSLTMLGDPADANSGGLYWDIQNLMDEMETTYDRINSILGEINKRAAYAWKDKEGWHLAMVEFGSFSLPRLDIEKSSSWLGLKKKECVVLDMPSNTTLDMWVWRYDQGKDLKFVGKGNIPWWQFRYGRDSTTTLEDEPSFMRDDSMLSSLDWVGLGLLNPDSSYLREIACFLCEHGLRSHARAHFGVNQSEIYIQNVDWTTSNYCNYNCPVN
jgi:hypothetical protein